MTWAECWTVAGWLIANGREEEGRDVVVSLMAAEDGPGWQTVAACLGWLDSAARDGVLPLSSRPFRKNKRKKHGNAWPIEQARAARQRAEERQGLAEASAEWRREAGLWVR